MERLLICEEGEEKILNVTNRVITIGRSSKNDIGVKDRNASRRHCNIIKVGDSWFVVDCDSHNGTFVNGDRIAKKELVEGDKISIGSVVISFLGNAEYTPSKRNDIEEEVVDEEIIDEGNSPPMIELDEIDEAPVEAEPVVEDKGQFIDDEKVEDVMDKPGKTPSAEKSDEKGAWQESEMEKIAQNVDTHLQKLREIYNQFQQQMGLAAIGQEQVGEILFLSLLSGGHCILKGGTSVTKDILLTRMAKILGLSFQHSFSTGKDVQNLKQGNLLLLEKIPADLAFSVFIDEEVIKSGWAGKKINKLSEPYMAIMTETAIERETLLRLLQTVFLFSISLRPFSYQQEVAFLEMALQNSPPVKNIASPHEICVLSRIVDNVKIDPNIVSYAVRLVRATRPQQEDRLKIVKEKIAKGGNSSLGLWILKAARVHAVLRGQQETDYQDVQFVAQYLVPARLQLTTVAQNTGDNRESIYKVILDHVPENAS